MKADSIAGQVHVGTEMENRAIYVHPIVKPTVRFVLRHWGYVRLSERTSHVCFVILFHVLELGCPLLKV